MLSFYIWSAPLPESCSTVRPGGTVVIFAGGGGVAGASPPAEAGVPVGLAGAAPGNGLLGAGLVAEGASGMSCAGGFDGGVCAAGSCANAHPAAIANAITQLAAFNAQMLRIVASPVPA